MVATHNLPADLYEALLSARRPGEHLLWCGRPSPRRVRQLSLMIFVIFGGQIINSLIQLLMPHTHPQAPLVIYLDLIMLLLASLAVSYPLYFVQKAKRTAYAITERRLLTAVRDRNGRIVVLHYERGDTEIAECVALPDGSGDLFYSKANNYFRSGGYVYRPTGCLIGIPNVREVERLLQPSAQNAAPASVVAQR